MSTTDVLSPEDLLSFEQNGFFHLKEAFDPEDAVTMQNHMWDQLNEMHGIDREDRSTWNRSTKWMGRNSDESMYRATGGPRLCGAIDQILGADNWQLPKKWGGFLITFPINATGVAYDIGQWHWDCNPMDYPDNHSGVFVFVLYSDIMPRGGGTLILSGSHRLILRFFERQSLKERKRKHKQQKRSFANSHPWLQELNGEAGKTRDLIQRFIDEPEEVDGVTVRVEEITGKPGDAYLCHPAMYHAVSMNLADEPRFMRAKMVGKEEV